MRHAGKLILAGCLTGYKLQDSGYRIQVSGYSIQVVVSGRPRPPPYFPAFCILHRQRTKKYPDPSGQGGCPLEPLGYPSGPGKSQSTDQALVPVGAETP